MIKLQNPSIPAPLQAIEIDLAIYNIMLKLDIELPWLSHEYGRAYKHTKIGADDGTRSRKRLYFPEVFIGGDKTGYYRPTTDNDKSGLCFFVVGEEENFDFDMNVQNYLRWDTGIIFSVNLKLINDQLLKNELFTQNLIREVREVLTRKIAGLGFTLEVKTVQRDPKKVFREFTFSEVHRYVRAPYQAFRFNCVITMQEACGAILNPVQSLSQVISQQEIIRGVLPNIDFSKPAFLDALTPQQRADLIAAICTP